jgi:hypothetical protein
MTVEGRERQPPARRGRRECRPRWRPSAGRAGKAHACSLAGTDAPRSVSPPSPLADNPASRVSMACGLSATPSKALASLPDPAPISACRCDHVHGRLSCGRRLHWAGGCKWSGLHRPADLHVADLHADGVEGYHRVDRALSRGGSSIPSTTLAVILYRDTSAPYTSTNWAAISPVANPLADNEIAISSTPVGRRCRYGRFEARSCRTVAWHADLDRRPRSRPSWPVNCASLGPESRHWRPMLCPCARSRRAQPSTVWRGTPKCSATAVIEPAWL